MSELVETFKSYTWAAPVVGGPVVVLGIVCWLMGL